MMPVNTLTSPPYGSRMRQPLPMRAVRELTLTITIDAEVLKRARLRSLQDTSVALAEPGRYVSLGVQNAPDIDMVIPLNVEHEIGKTLDRPATKAWQLQLMGIARRAGGRITSDV